MSFNVIFVFLPLKTEHAPSLLVFFGVSCCNKGAPCYLLGSLGQAAGGPGAAGLSHSIIARVGLLQ